MLQPSWPSLPALSILIFAMVDWTRPEFTLLAKTTHFEEVFLAPQCGQENVIAPVRPAFTQPHFLQSRIS